MSSIFNINNDEVRFNFFPNRFIESINVVAKYRVTKVCERNYKFNKLKIGGRDTYVFKRKL